MYKKRKKGIKEKSFWKKINEEKNNKWKKEHKGLSIKKEIGKKNELGSQKE